jgi:hypothetical protein
MSATQILANRIRQNALKMVHRAKASHIASALSITDILAVLYGQVMYFDPNDQDCVLRDRFILSKGHACVATVLPSIGRHLASLLGSITPRASITTQLPTDGGLVPIQQFGYFRLIVSGFHKGVNLISFSLAEVFVGHKQLRLPGQEALNAKHPQPPNHPLFKVALRA